MLKPSTHRYLLLSLHLKAAIDNAPGINRDRFRAMLAQEVRLATAAPCYWGRRERFAVVVSQVTRGIARWASVAPAGKPDAVQSAVAAE